MGLSELDNNLGKEKCIFIWSVALYDKRREGECISNEFFVKEEAARKYIKENKDMWEQEGLFYTFGSEYLWL